jgi:hypothetical protein
MMLIYRANDSEQNDRAEHRDNDERPNVFRKGIPNIRQQLPEIVTEEKQQQKRANEQCGDHGSSSLIIDYRVALIRRFVDSLLGFFQIRTWLYFHGMTHVKVCRDKKYPQIPMFDMNNMSIEPKCGRDNNADYLITGIYDRARNIISRIKYVANLRLLIKVVHMREIIKPLLANVNRT